MRAKLITAIKQAFSEYNFHHGFIYDVNSMAGATFPIAWLTPPRLLSKSGRNDGEVIYQVVLYLFDKRINYTDEDKIAIWTKLENDAIAGFIKLQNGNEDILTASKLQCDPDEFSLTGYKELSIKVSFEVTIPYCYES